MIGRTRMQYWSSGKTKAAALSLVLAALSACASSGRFGGTPQDQIAATPQAPPPPPPPPAPPVDLAGKWKLSAAGGASCAITFGDSPASPAEGTVAPAGGCPGNFFTSRKWAFDHDMLIIRDHKDQVLVELSFADGRFTGQAVNGGGAITLAKP
jgi:hypothetical protein